MLSRLRESFLWRIVQFAILLVILFLSGAAWWLWPPSPRLRWDAWPVASSLVISRDDQVLATAHRDRLVLWGTSTGNRRKTLPLFRQIETTPSSLWLSPDGQTVIFALSEEWGKKSLEYWCWRPAIEDKPQELGPSQAVWSFSSDSRLVLTGAGQTYVKDQPARLFDTASLEVRWSTTDDSAWVFDALSNDTELLVLLVHPDYSLSVFDLLTQRESFRLPPPKNNTRQGEDGKEYVPHRIWQGARFAAGGQLVAWIERSEIVIWDVARKRQRSTVPKDPRDTFTAIIWSADGARLATEAPPPPNGGDAEWIVWDVTVSPARELGRVPTDPEFSRDGRWATCSQRLGPNFRTAFFDTSDLRQVWQQPWKLPDFSPDSRTLVAHADSEERWLDKLVGRTNPFGDDELLLLEPATGRTLGVFPDAVEHAFFADGRSIAIGNRDGTIEIWDVPPRRRPLVEYGLPVVFALLLLRLGKLCLRAGRRRNDADQPPAETVPS